MFGKGFSFFLSSTSSDGEGSENDQSEVLYLSDELNEDNVNSM